MAPVASPDPSASDWTAYDSVTEAEVQGWCWANGVDQEAIEASLQADIDLQITPPLMALEYLGNGFN